MITIPWWLFSAMLAVITSLSLGLFYALVKRETLADRRLDRELYRNPDYIRLAMKRLQDAPLFTDEETS